VNRFSAVALVIVWASAAPVQSQASALAGRSQAEALDSKRATCGRHDARGWSRLVAVLQTVLKPSVIRKRLRQRQRLHDLLDLFLTRYLTCS
jgi:hypothetical protein